MYLTETVAVQSVFRAVQSVFRALREEPSAVVEGICARVAAAAGLPDEDRIELLNTLLAVTGCRDHLPPRPVERSNRTIGAGEASDAAAVVRVYDKTRELMRLVPKAGMGSHVVTDPSGWRVEITRGEVGCGDAHRFHVAATRRGLHPGTPDQRFSSELLIVVRRGQVHIDLPEIKVEQTGDFTWQRIHEMVARVVGVQS